MKIPYAKERLLGLPYDRLEGTNYAHPIPLPWFSVVAP
jgi:hypothetical protein